MMMKKTSQLMVVFSPCKVAQYFYSTVVGQGKLHSMAKTLHIPLTAVWSSVSARTIFYFMYI